jgi:AcrR family transcriptional regulator
MERPTSSGERGRPRLASTDLAIRDAALQLLRAQGPGTVNIEAVAARSGVARTTIYRRYGSRAELLDAVVAELLQESLPAPALPVPDKVRWVLERVTDLFEHGIGPGGTAAVLTDSDPAFTSALRERLAVRLRELTDAMTLDIESGRLSRHVDPDVLIGLLIGAYLGEVLRHGTPRAEWVDGVVEFLAPGLEPGGRPDR